ncbi:DUF3990 domain-containing protein [Bifidobacterium oedipodis]|uniref:Sortase n=1 Tax=Bifidobacterium oedipodis TaxID=2675322 RepID=A0A7Y0EPD6_9BIFI|nr:DUF3990 domain-containing protein [Bifidobacterium sp. DSM 109957]NMM93981.1 hypothetical protein [Bifidobacterium sp. DSM 109957]
MLLYHGSNVEVRSPKLLHSDRRLDFGTGFYLTSSFEQASRWALLTTRRRGQGEALISVFGFDRDTPPNLNILEFHGANADWLRFVSANRNGVPEQPELDIVIGPVANDNTMPVLRRFFANIYTEEEAIRRLMTQKLKDQYAFKTQSALDALTFKEVLTA